MKGKQFLLLFLALLLPACIFIFLRTFGENEFDVAPLFAEEVPAGVKENCGTSFPVPYVVADSVLQTLITKSDSIVCVSFSDASLGRVQERYATDPVQWKKFSLNDHQEMAKCIFLLAEPFDIALVDRRGAIRGQYNSAKRDEIDRLITEIAIILKKY